MRFVDAVMLGLNAVTLGVSVGLLLVYVDDRSRRRREFGAREARKAADLREYHRRWPTAESNERERGA